MSVPLSLSGVLYRVGPGRFERGGVTYASPLDGDGRVDRIEFRNGRVKVTSRFVETPAFLAEERANAILHRRAFGTGSHLSLRTLKNEANTALVHHGGELMALWEGGHASAIDPDTLAYLGPHTLGGAARVAPAFSMHPAIDGALGIGGDAVCAHSHVDPASGRLVMLLTRFALGKTTLRFVEFESGGFEVYSERTYVAHGFTHVHDFVVTPKSYVFFHPPLEFDAIKFRRGASALECVTQAGGTTRVVRMDRRGKAEPETFDVPRWYATHLINAVETEGAELVVDTFGIPFLGGGPYDLRSSSCKRVVISLEGKMCMSFGTIDSQTSEFPAVCPTKHGRVYDFAFYSGSKHTPMDSLVRLNALDGTKRYATLRGSMHMEPVLAGDYVLVFVLREGKQFLRVMEAETLRSVVTLPMEETNLLGLHGLWVPG